MSSPAAIEIRRLVKVFAKGGHPVTAVDGLDLDVYRGEIFGLLGPNGAGKTTTVEICEGLQEPTSGEVRVLGSSWDRHTAGALRERLGVSLQETEFFGRQSVTEILTLFRSFYPRGYSVKDAIAMVSLEDKAWARYRNLSGGQRQRLAVASALIGRPELLFLDEPTTGLDPSARRQLWEVVRDFRSSGGTVLLTTHYMEEAEILCDRVGVVDHGKLIALGTPSELISSLGGDHVIEARGRGIDAVPDAALGGLPGCRSFQRREDHLVIAADAVHLSLPPLLSLLDGDSLEGLTVRQASLEDVFVQLTGRGFDESEEVPA